MLEHSRHLPGGGRHTCNCHDRLPIDFENFVRPLVNDGVPGSRSPIARDEDAVNEFECENRGRFSRLKVFRGFSWPVLPICIEQAVTPKYPRKVLQAAR